MQKNIYILEGSNKTEKLIKEISHIKKKFN